MNIEIEHLHGETEGNIFSIQFCTPLNENPTR